MVKAVISGDIVSSTSLSDAGRLLIEDRLTVLLRDLKQEYNVYGRIVKGDYIECVLDEPYDALRVALAIKSFVKSIPIEETLHYKNNNRVKHFKIHGVRLAIGYGNLSRYDADKGIIDGEAIYLSGRAIGETFKYHKERIVIKNTLYFVSNNTNLNKEFEPLLSLLDVLIGKATSRQCQVLYLKLMNYNEDSIAAKLKINQSVVNQHSTSIGWNAIDKAVKHFSFVIKHN
ncbi:MAG: hypothetical protein K9J13_16440 [Saprospiraceae bacterium]|nr:hypothetical protein [Saprospiraceae bacterium]